VLEAAQVHHSCAYFVVEIESGGHLHWIVEVDLWHTSVAEEQRPAGKLLAQTHVESHVAVVPVRAEVGVFTERIADGEAVVGAQRHVLVRKEASRLLVDIAMVAHEDGHCQWLQHVVHDVVHALPHSHYVQMTQ
jgi:hypothetical protein